jgi:hypothetical protein
MKKPAKKRSNKAKIRQWNTWLKSLSMHGGDRAFTKELYETLHTRCNMIAHFDRQGFIKARFWTLADFDQTLISMRSSKIGKDLLKNTDGDLLANARYAIAVREARTLTQQARVILDHVEKLQSNFTKQF